MIKNHRGLLLPPMVCTFKAPAMTQRYAHLRDETLKNASKVANDIIMQSTKKKKDKVVEIKYKIL
jgi:hypothetical protein